LEEVAGRLWRLYVHPAPEGVDPARVLREGVIQAVGARAQRVKGNLKSLAESASAALRSAAIAFGIAEFPAEESAADVLRGMPVFELGLLEVRMKPPRLFLRFGGSAARSWLRGRLENQIGEQLLRHIDTYGELLKAWSQMSLRQLEQWFSSHADGYRAQAERLLGSTGHSGREEDLLEDLKQLAVEPNGAKDSVEAGERM
jgi:hypothetical protein